MTERLLDSADKRDFYPKFTREPTPVDELTGIPLLIVPDEETPYLLENPRINAARRASGGKYFADWNHAYHPRLSAELTSKDGKAIRDCRGQFVMRLDHDDYHLAYAGPPLPQTNEARFRSLVFCAAGYVPRRALDFSGNSPKEVTLRDDQINRLQTGGEIRVMDRKPVKDFLMRYVLESPEIDHIPRKLINDFLKLHQPETDDDRNRQCALAHQLLSLVIEPRTAPLYNAYKQSLSDNLWRPEAHSPRKLVHNEIAGGNSRNGRKRSRTIRKIGDLLYDKLAAYRDLAPAA